MPATMAAFGLALAMVLTGCPTSTSNNDHWGSASMLESAHPNNDFGTTSIVLEFDGSVVGLRPENVLVFPGTGDVRTGELTGSGSRWSLGVTVLRYGAVSVKIDREGISPEVHEVMVHPVVWTARWDDSNPQRNALVFSFRVPVAELGLAAGDFRLLAPVGNAIPGELTHIDGVNWSLAVTLEGDVSYVMPEIYREGITPFGSKDAIGPVPIPTTTITLERAVIDASAVTGEKSLVLTFSKPVLSLAVENIQITNGTGAFRLGRDGLTAQDGLSVSDGGITWTVPVTIETPGGLASVSIDRNGISKKPVTVDVPGITLINAYLCDSEVPGQKSLVLVFSGPVPGLIASNIVVNNGTGIVFLGRPGLTAEEGLSTADNGVTWTVPITIEREGQASVSVNKPGIQGGPISFTVPPLIFIESARYQVGDVGNRWIEFTLSQPVPGLGRANVTVAEDSGAVTPAQGAGSLHGTHPWTTWRLDVESIQREGSVLLSITGMAGVSETPVRVTNVQQVHVIGVRILNSWVDIDPPAGKVTPPRGEGSVGLEVVLSAPVAVAPSIIFRSKESSGTLLVEAAGDVFGSGTTWVLPLSVANNALDDGHWGSGRLNNVEISGQAAPLGALGNIRPITIPEVWGLVGPGAPVTWTDPNPQRLPGDTGWNDDTFDW